MMFKEIFHMAMNSIWANKLRSFLTLIGIIAGVASIIGVMTGISVIQKTMEKEMSVLGATVFQVQKQLNGPASRAEWLRSLKRPATTVENANAIREKVTTVTLVGPELWSYNHNLKYRDISTNGNSIVCGASPEYAPNNTHLIGHGRNLSREDMALNKKVVVIGYAVAKTLFPWTDPIGKIVRIDGRKFRVIGVFEEKKSSMGGGYDNYNIIPIGTFVGIYGMRNRNNGGRERSVNITVRAKSPELLHDAIEETRAVMRRERKLKFGDEDNFTIFSNDSQIKQFNEMTAGVKVGAFVIGIVALIVAGIGIMNIMLVAVTERTREIGVRKALGAKRKNILGQFLMEAIVLSNIGGVFGILVGFGLGNIVSFTTGFAVSIPMDWAIIGLTFCTSIGLIFGLWPAYKASLLIPVHALRYE